MHCPGQFRALAPFVVTFVPFSIFVIRFERKPFLRFTLFPIVFPLFVRFEFSSYFNLSALLMLFLLFEHVIKYD